MNIATYFGKISSLTFRIFIAEDFTLNGKSTYFESVVKSSKIMHGKLEYIPLVSFVCPIMKDFPAVNTGVKKVSLYSVEDTMYNVGCS